MCKFFSFITYKGEMFYFDKEQRRTNKDCDSHSNIAMTFLGSTIKEDKANKWEWFNGALIADSYVDLDECIEDVQHKMQELAGTRKYWALTVDAIIAGTADLDDISETMRQPTETLLHEYACWCAEQVLDKYEQWTPGDSSVRDAIKAKRDWLAGTITLTMLESAARSAAWSAARSAESAARSAWSAARSAESAARSAESAARSAESAARSEAWSAARSAAWSAARSAAWSAARSAARSEARSAIVKLQQNKLDDMLELVWPK